MYRDPATRTTFSLANADVINWYVTSVTDSTDSLEVDLRK